MQITVLDSWKLLLGAACTEREREKIWLDADKTRIN